MTEGENNGSGGRTDIRMPPDVWGPIFWHAMHIVSLAYPVHPSEEDKAGARAFFESLTKVLPCPVCREHYKEQLAKSPVSDALNSKGDLILWVWDIHNEVNIMLGKPTISVDEFLDHMRALGRGETTDSETCCSPTWSSLAGVGTVGLLLGVGAFYAWTRLRGGRASA